MEEYKRVTWVDANDDGTIPSDAPSICAKNLNNIENGIQQALEKASSAKDYADTNIMFFTGTFKSSVGTWVKAFQLPTKFDDGSDITLSKYTVLISTDRVSNHNYFKAIPYDTDVTLYYENWKYIKVNVSNSGVISFWDDGGNNTVNMNIILLPTKQQTLTALKSN